MVCIVAVAAVTGFLAPAWWLDVHVIAGYALAALLAFRLAWGFLGSHYSTFRTFPLSWDGVVEHLRLILRNKSPVYIGHNPVGALMIVILLVALVSLVVTGLITLGGQQKLGPLAFLTTYEIGHFSKDIHEIAAWGVVLAIAIHLAGVLVETRIFRHTIILPMITGRKALAGKWLIPKGRDVSARGVILSVLGVGVLVAGGTVLASRPPAGWRPLEFPAVYASECGDCHVAYHPSLRSAKAWRAIMAGLSDHYGEDASLGRKTAESITKFLTASAAETFDTTVAHRIGRKETASFRMTDTRRWKAWHKGIDASVFRRRAVGSKVNCNACHKDAPSGRFYAAEIHLPTGDQ